MLSGMMIDARKTLAMFEEAIPPEVGSDRQLSVPSLKEN
jgi:hypothetical protein